MKGILLVKRFFLETAGVLLDHFGDPLEVALQHSEATLRVLVNVVCHLAFQINLRLRLAVDYLVYRFFLMAVCLVFVVD